MGKFFFSLIAFLFMLSSCNWKPETNYSTKYTYFFTKRDLVNDSFVNELCKKPWFIYQFENRRFIKRKMVYNDSREWLNNVNAFEVMFNKDSTITAHNPEAKGTWSINNNYFLEFDFNTADTSIHLTGKFDVKMRGDDLMFNKGIYTNDTISETIKLHFFRNADEIKIF
jgi:hypothetical protein